ncbi:hypothetical protein MTR_2g018570 [Medicago truncatula]|uniref:Uncharacterized protein n=1 Tax=Medicago truncatula TaxID=3880 RepID=G7ILY0_MEDTR|nr:hypothetical protein MTR_2g018570 [Medicago truncatula]
MKTYLEFRFSQPLQLVHLDPLNHDLEPLSGNHFAGKIPTHLAELCSTLVELDISINNLNSEILRKFGACTSLPLYD